MPSDVALSAIKEARVGRWARVLYGALGLLVVLVAIGSAAALTFGGKV